MADLTGIGTLAGIGLTGVDMAIEGSRNQRAFEQQQQLMGMQQKNQMQLNEQGMKLQKGMWDYTNYENQMGHMKRAGLNPALMYGMKGGGGVTTGSQGGGSAASGNAPGYNGMGIEGMMMGAQIEKMNAETQEIKARTGKEEQETTNLGQLFETLKNETKSSKEKADIDTLERMTKELDYELSKESFNYNLKVLGEKAREITQQNDRFKANYENFLNQEFARTLEIQASTLSKQAGTELTQKDIENYEAAFNNILKNTEIMQQNAWTKELSVAVTQELGKLNISQKNKEMWHKSITKVMGDLLGLGGDYMKMLTFSK